MSAVAENETEDLEALFEQIAAGRSAAQAPDAAAPGVAAATQDDGAGKAGDAAPAEVKAEEVHVAEVHYQLFPCLANTRVVKRSECRRRAGVHERGGALARCGSDHCPGTGEVLWEIIRAGGEGEQVIARAHRAAKVVEAKDPIRYPGRRVAVVKTPEGKAIEVRGLFEGSECGADRSEVEVAEDHLVPIERVCFIL